MAYVSSNNIQVFPTTKRPDKSVESRQMSEQNIIRLVNMLLDVEGFVIDSDLETTNNKFIEFNIDGYYFKLLNAGVAEVQSLLNASSTGSIWASILVTETGSTGYKELQGQDTQSGYEGITFSTSDPESNANTYKLKILEKSNNTWSIPSTSIYKFSQTSISNLNLDEIDGGEIS